MSYNNIVSAISVAIILNSCEIIRIGGNTKVLSEKKTLVTDKIQSIGSLNAFKLEADNNNYYAMLDFLSNDGSFLLAADKIELSDEIQRLCRVIKNQELTKNMIDTIGTEKHNISLQINYTKNYRYYLNKIENYWYIYDYEKIDNQESNNTNSTLEKTTHN
jgi:hypothetical protein